MAHLFVYGTLKRGGANFRIMAGLGARPIAAARTVVPRTLVDLGPYPALLEVDPARDAKATPVRGEVIAIDDHALPAVDAFEGVPELYRRERIAVVVEDGATMDVFTYVLAIRVPRRARVIPDGRYEASGAVLEDGASETQVADDGPPAR